MAELAQDMARRVFRNALAVLVNLDMVIHAGLGIDVFFPLHPLHLHGFPLNFLGNSVPTKEITTGR